MTRLHVGALLAALLLFPALGACGSSDDDADATPISYSRSGGIAGIDERLEITADDDVLFGRDGAEPAEVDVDQALIDAARAQLDEVDFGDLPGPSGPIPDDFSYSLAYGSERASGGFLAVEASSPLGEALASLNAIVEAAER